MYTIAIIGTSLVFNMVYYIIYYVYRKTNARDENNNFYLTYYYNM